MLKKYSLKRDFIYSLIPSIIIYLIYISSSVIILNFSIKDITGISIGLFGSLLGFIITAITVLLMFNYDKNEILKKIKDAGLFNQIFERYVSSVIVLFISLIVFIFFNIFSAIIEQSVFKIFSESIIIFFIIFSMIRIYRNIRLLKDILDVI